MRDGVNQRTDEYGGSYENRFRLASEVLDQLISVYGASRVGIKLSPVNDYNGMKDSDPENLVKHLVEYLNQKDIAFIELMETFSLEGKDAANKKAFFEGKSYTSFRQAFKRSFKNTWIANHGLTQETAN